MHKFTSPVISTVSLEEFWLTVFLNELTKKTAEEEEEEEEEEEKLKLQAALAGSSKTKFAGKGICADVHAAHTHFRAFVPVTCPQQIGLYQLYMLIQLILSATFHVNWQRRL